MQDVCGLDISCTLQNFDIKYFNDMPCIILANNYAVDFHTIKNAELYNLYIKFESYIRDIINLNY